MSNPSSPIRFHHSAVQFWIAYPWLNPLRHYWAPTGSPCPRSAHTTHLLPQPISSAHIVPRKKLTPKWPSPHTPPPRFGVMFAVFPCRPRQPSSEGMNVTDQKSIIPGYGSPTTFSRVGNASPVVASLLLLSGDVETNPGPRCYACGQNIRQSDTALACHTPACGATTHKQTRCSDLPCAQQSLPWHCPTHRRPGPPVPTEISPAATAVTTRSTGEECSPHCAF